MPDCKITVIINLPTLDDGREIIFEDVGGYIKQSTITLKGNTYTIEENPTALLNTSKRYVYSSAKTNLYLTDSSAMRISALLDCAILSLTNNHVLKYDSGSSKWVNAPITFDFPLSYLNDCTFTNPSQNDLLTYDGTQWVNQHSHMSLSYMIFINSTKITGATPEFGVSPFYNVLSATTSLLVDCSNITEYTRLVLPNIVGAGNGKKVMYFQVFGTIDSHLTFEYAGIKFNTEQVYRGGLDLVKGTCYKATYYETGGINQWSFYPCYAIEDNSEIILPHSDIYLLETLVTSFFQISVSLPPLQEGRKITFKDSGGVLGNYGSINIYLDGGTFIKTFNTAGGSFSFVYSSVLNKAIVL
jgi:hypothetical protein